MFPTFSGSSRRPRQVNLSGRKPHAFGNTGTGSGSQAALDRAQQERAQRQREREALQAAQTLQRLWRGHSCRKRVADVLRQEWDAVEGHTGSQNHSSKLEPYASEEESLTQLRRLIQFSNTRDAHDVQRIRHYGLRQIKTASSRSMTASGPWVSAYLQLQKIILTILDRQGADLDSQRYPFVEILTILLFLTDQIPSETSQSAEHFYRTLASVVSKLSSLIEASPENPQYTDAIKVSLETVITPLKRVTGYTLNAYEAFGYRIMSLPVVATESKPDGIHQVRHFLAESINYKLLANALATSFKDSGLYSHATLKDVAARFRLLGSFIYFHRHAHDFRSPEAYSAHRDFVAVVSVLLNSLPSNIVEGHVADSEDAEATETEAEAEVNGFLKEQILSLVNQEGIGNLLSGATTAEEASENEKIEEARHFANYALALLRFFPRRGDEIRMWLYMGPTPSQSPSWNLPAIRYFWKATKHSSVFATILRDSRAAIELLRPKADSSSTNLARGSFWQAPQQAVDRTAVRADEWRVIFVFLELYTFVSKVTDDEEFFSAAKDPFSNEVRDNALPLSEVKDLSTFLKNLGFTLYFNASDINGPEEPESSSTSLSFFSPRVEDTQPQRQASEPSVGGVPGLSLDYIKGLVTGLLRMLYERDSRRAFLPKEHWLMTSRFDMTAFIPSVVQEEESRHKIREQDAEDADEEDDYVIEGDQPIIGTRRTQHQRRWERIQRQQRKASRRRYLQAVAPRLEILQNMPFLIPFQTRVQIFREFIKLDMTKQRGDPDAFNFRMAMGLSGARHAAKIRREHEFEDAFEQFYPLGAALKEPIQITFIDQFQAVEAGIDGGGVTKEFLTSVTSRAFEPSDRIDMFVTNDQHLLYPNPSAIEELKAAMRQAGLSENSEEFRLQVKGLLQRYEFLGRIIGKCLYEGILVDVNFAPFFLRKWALTGGTGSAPRESGYRATLNDLRDLDEGLYQGLHQLKNYKGDVEDFALNFTVTDTIVVDHTTNPKKTRAVTRELKPNGSNIPVTNQNRLVYISFMARHRLQNQPYAQTMSFLKGLSSMIQPGWLSMFNHSELQTLLGGTSSSIDVEDLRRNTQYGGTYVIGDDGQEHPTIKLFWKVMKDMSDGERRAVLKFVTSTPRAPLLGFSTLNPNFSIRDSGSDQDRLPSTSTCVNLLKLPMYQNEMVLKEKLLYSVFSGAGFDLS